MLQELMEISVSQVYPLGMRYALDDRAYRYIQADADRQLRAAYGVFPQITYAETGVPTVEAAAEQKVVSLTAVGTVVANEFAGGILSKAGGGGGGYGVNYKIASNTAPVGGVFTVTLRDNIITAIPVGDTVTLFHSPWRRVVSMRQRLIDGIATDYKKVSWIGVPNRFITKDYFGWIQTWGPCMVVPAAGTEGVADDERAMAWENDGSITKIQYDVVTMKYNQYAGFVLPVTTAGAIPDLLEIFLQIAP